MPFSPNWCVPPCETLNELVAARGICTNTLAMRLRISIQDVYQLQAGRMRITEELAGALFELFGAPASFWLKLQKNFDRGVANPDFYISTKNGSLARNPSNTRYLM